MQESNFNDLAAETNLVFIVTIQRLSVEDMITLSFPTFCLAIQISPVMSMKGQR